VPVNAARAEGIIKNTNTMEAFRQADKVEILNNAARQVRFYQSLFGASFMDGKYVDWFRSGMP